MGDIGRYTRRLHAPVREEIAGGLLLLLLLLSPVREEIAGGARLEGADIALGRVPALSVHEVRQRGHEVDVEDDLLARRLALLAAEVLACQSDETLCEPS